MRHIKCDSVKEIMSRKDWTDEKLTSRLINNKMDKSRWDNISALRKRPSQELFAKCVELTKSNNPKIRKIGIDNINAIETLIKLSSDKLSHIRNWATFGLGTQIERNNKTIREALWARVNDKHQETKLEAIVGLAKRKDKRVNDIIKREIIGGEYGILLFEAIIETQNKEFLPLLK